MRAEGRETFLDGMRGWAAVNVLLFHLFIDGFPANALMANKNLWSRVFILYGLDAVYAFFVISGFALSIGYIRRPDNVALAQLAIGRYARLAIPIFSACLVVYLLMTFGLIVPVADKPALTNALAFEPSLDHLLVFSFYRVFFAYSHDQSFVPPLWTMSIELIGSFIVFGLLALFARFRFRIPIYCAVAFVLLVEDSYYALFVFGIILAEMFNSDYPLARSLCGLCLALGAGIILIFGGRYRAAEMLGVALLITGAIFLPSVRGFFETRASAFLGWISFPLYLIHAPVMHSFSIWLLTALTMAGSGPQTSRILVALASVPVCIAAAILMTPVNKLAIIVARSMGGFLEPLIGHKLIQSPTPRRTP